MTRQELRVFLSDHFCGCGNPRGAAGALLRMLEVWGSKDLAAYQEFPKLVQDDGAMFLLVYLVDGHMGLTEHGGGILSSWLNAKGQEVLAALRAEPADGFKALCAMHCVHGYDVDDRSHVCS